MSPNKSIDTDVLSAGVSRRPSPVISNVRRHSHFHPLRLELTCPGKPAHAARVKR
jgi:hypothetical protein